MYNQFYLEIIKLEKFLSFFFTWIALIVKQYIFFVSNKSNPIPNMHFLKNFIIKSLFNEKYLILKQIRKYMTNCSYVEVQLFLYFGLPEQKAQLNFTDH